MTDDLELMYDRLADETLTLDEVLELNWQLTFIESCRSIEEDSEVVV